MSKAKKYPWHFFKVGGVFQAQIVSAQDIARIGELDRKLWAALSCPTSGLEFDAATLAYLDANQDGKIHRDEVVEACRWTSAALKDNETLLQKSDMLALSQINETTEEGHGLLMAAQRILANLGKPDAQEISLADLADSQSLFAQTRFNADGIITPESAGDDMGLKAYVEDILAVLPGKTDRSGKPGVDMELLEQYDAQAKAYLDWLKRAEDVPSPLPLKENTQAAYDLVQKLAPKIKDYFTRADILRFDETAAALVNASEDELKEVLKGDASPQSEKLRELPLAHVEKSGELKLSAAFNPAWQADMDALRTSVVTPLLGEKQALTKADWDKLNELLAPFAQWQADKITGTLPDLPLERVMGFVTTNAREKIAALIAQDEALKPEYENIRNVEKLLCYHRYLHEFLCNFVNFRSFYNQEQEAIFQWGHLYIDQRQSTLTIPITDVAKHASLANLSYFYLAYCECRRQGEAPMTIAAAITAGDSDNLMVGRNGLFYDRHGRDWDTTIVRIVDNPISIRQAFWQPYKRLMKWIAEQIAKRAAAADSKVSTSLQQGVDNTATATPAAAPAKKIDVGTVAALGVAVGGITAGLGMLGGALASLGPWMPVAIVGVILAISLPSMLMAWLKLRLRNLAPLLDANGWAVNTKALVNIKLGTRLTKTAHLPPGAKRDFSDPTLESSHWKRWILLGMAIVVIAAAVLSWKFGYFTKEQDPAEPPAQAETAQPPAPPAEAPEAAK